MDSVVSDASLLFATGYNQSVCPDCGKKIKTGEGACLYCGCPIEERVDLKCPGCGEYLPLGTMTCPKCGSIIKETIDYKKLFLIEKDEFDNTTDVKTILPPDDINSDAILLGCTEREGVKQYYIFEPTGTALDVNSSNNTSEGGFESTITLRGAIINIDGTETIKLAEVRNGNSVLMDKEQVVKCCNANTIIIKLFTTNGECYTFGENTGRNKLMIDAFRALYHYNEDKTMYLDSLVRLQQWFDQVENKIKEEEEHEKKGGIPIIISVILFSIGVIMLINAIDDFPDSFLLLILSIISISVGLGFLFFRIAKLQGKNNEEAWDDAVKIIDSIFNSK